MLLVSPNKGFISVPLRPKSRVTGNDANRDLKRDCIILFTITGKDIDMILHDYDILSESISSTELQRYYYEKDDPASGQIRLIITSEEYDTVRSYLAEELEAPIGMLEAENMLWKKEL